MCIKPKLCLLGIQEPPLIKKLGIRDDMKLLILYPPNGMNAYWKLIGADCSTQLCKSTEDPDFIYVFATSQKEFQLLYDKIKLRLRGNVSLWVSWYKKSAGIPTDLTEDKIRAFALRNNLVDIKVCAVTERWSGLKLVIPTAKR